MLWETMIQWAPVVLRKCFDAVWQVTLPWMITILLLMLLRPFLLRRYSVKCYLNCMRIMMGLLIMSMTAYSGNAYWQIPGPDVLLSHELEVSSAQREEMPVEAPASGENLAQQQETADLDAAAGAACAGANEHQQHQDGTAGLRPQVEVDGRKSGGGDDRRHLKA